MLFPSENIPRLEIQTSGVEHHGPSCLTSHGNDWKAAVIKGKLLSRHHGLNSLDKVKSLRVESNRAEYW